MTKRAQYVMVPEDDPQWVRFWNAYPRRCSKKDARHAWTKLNPTVELVGEMVVALGWQVPLYRWDGDKQDYAPYPATWLNCERWKDEPPTPVAAASTPPWPSPLAEWKRLEAERIGAKR